MNDLNDGVTQPQLGSPFIESHLNDDFESGESDTTDSQGSDTDTVDRKKEANAVVSSPNDLADNRAGQPGAVNREGSDFSELGDGALDNHNPLADSLASSCTSASTSSSPSASTTPDPDEKKDLGPDAGQGQYESHIVDLAQQPSGIAPEVIQRSDSSSVLIVHPLTAVAGAADPTAMTPPPDMTMLVRSLDGDEPYAVRFLPTEGYKSVLKNGELDRPCVNRRLPTDDRLAKALQFLIYTAASVYVGWLYARAANKASGYVPQSMYNTPSYQVLEWALFCGGGTINGWQAYLGIGNVLCQVSKYSDMERRDQNIFLTKVLFGAIAAAVVILTQMSLDEDHACAAPKGQEWLECLFAWVVGTFFLHSLSESAVIQSMWRTLCQYRQPNSDQMAHLQAGLLVNDQMPIASNLSCHLKALFSMAALTRLGFGYKNVTVLSDTFKGCTPNLNQAANYTLSISLAFSAILTSFGLLAATVSYVEEGKRDQARHQAYIDAQPLAYRSGYTFLRWIAYPLLLFSVASTLGVAHTILSDLDVCHEDSCWDGVSEGEKWAAYPFAVVMAMGTIIANHVGLEGMYQWYKDGVATLTGNCDEQQLPPDVFVKLVKGVKGISNSIFSDAHNSRRNFSLPKMGMGK